MRDLFKKYIQGKRVMIIFAFTNLVYLVMLLITIPHVMHYSHGMDLFDMMPAGYDAGYAHTLLNALGADGRNAYMQIQLPVDMIYPFLFGLTYSLMLAYFLYKLSWIDKPIFVMVFFPIVTALFDYAENIGIFSMLHAYPDFSTRTAAALSLLTIIKSALSTVSFLMLLSLVVIFLVRRMKSLTMHYRK